MGIRKDVVVEWESICDFFFFNGLWVYVPRVEVALSLPSQLILSWAEGKGSRKQVG